MIGFTLVPDWLKIPIWATAKQNRYNGGLSPALDWTSLWGFIRRRNNSSSCIHHTNVFASWKKKRWKGRLSNRVDLAQIRNCQSLNAGLSPNKTLCDSRKRTRDEKNQYICFNAACSSQGFVLELFDFLTWNVVCRRLEAARVVSYNNNYI